MVLLESRAAGDEGEDKTAELRTKRVKHFCTATGEQCDQKKIAKCL